MVLPVIFSLMRINLIIEEKFLFLNFYGSTDPMKTGNINITASKNSYIAEDGFTAIRSFTPGGAGDMNIKTGDLVGKGLDMSSNTEFWVMAHNGKTGELNIESELFDARQVRILNIAEKYNKKLKRSELKTYGDVNISAKDIKLENFILVYGSTQNENRSTLFDRFRIITSGKTYKYREVECKLIILIVQVRGWGGILFFRQIIYTIGLSPMM